MSSNDLHLKSENKKWSRPLSGGRWQCLICPHGCILLPGETGKCLVRVARENEISNPCASRLSSIGFDPIEKKPLFHFYPGKKILSLGSVGCNLHCLWCQNYSISQIVPSNLPALKSYSVTEILSVAREEPGNIGVAFTYNEPAVALEFLLEVAGLFHQSGMSCCMVTNGFINPAPLEAILEVVDAFNVDLKGFTEEFYKTYTKGRLSNVLQSLSLIRKAGKHLEVTFLAVPNLNTSLSDFEAMCKWIACHLGDETPLHISRYYPAWHYRMPATPYELLTELFEKARNILRFVYLGNVPGNVHESTFCPDCSALLVERRGYLTIIKGLEQNKCSGCGHQIPGVF